MGNRVLFLDRDGPINIVGPKGFVHQPQYFHFTDGIFRICREAMKKDYKIIIITNQTGIGLKDYTEQDMLDVHESMLKKFKKERIKITDIFYTKYPTSANRKPSPGMYLLAKEKFELKDYDMFRSCSIGDRRKDAEAALRAGVGRVIYYRTDKALDDNYKVITRKPNDLSQEIAGLRQEFQTLAVLGELAKKEGLFHKPKTRISHRPKMFLIDHYRQIEGRL